MHIHILGVCGTFMAGIALLARGAGHRVSGSDANAYPPMSTQLENLGIEVREGYDPQHLQPAPDCVVIGNALSRGNPAVEYVLNAGLSYTSGPDWLAQHVLFDKHVLAVAGTHGKTTTSSALAWILEFAGHACGFLIGGVPQNFGVSARHCKDAADHAFFVLEADEYDSAFFDKRSKFIHYRPRTLVLNNLEFDHADIFDDLEAIKRQFHHLVRTVPGQGAIFCNAADSALRDVIERGCWTPVASFGEQAGDWQVRRLSDDASEFEIRDPYSQSHRVQWELLGTHNAMNAVAAVAAAHGAGIDVKTACAALGHFKSVKRRLELRGEIDGIAVYDDFAHHPSAIVATLTALRARVGDARILALVDPASSSMRSGVHADTLGPSLLGADGVWLYQHPRATWQLGDACKASGLVASVHANAQDIVDSVLNTARTGDVVLIMSNSGFDGLHEKLLNGLEARSKNRES